MPSKTKNRNKNNNKGRGQRTVVAPAPTMPSVAGMPSAAEAKNHGSGQGGGSKLEMKFLKNDNFDFKKLAKVPEVAEQLKAGTIKPSIAAPKMAFKLVPPNSNNSKGVKCHYMHYARTLAFCWPVDIPTITCSIHHLSRKEKVLFTEFASDCARRFDRRIEQHVEEWGGRAEGYASFMNIGGELMQDEFEKSCMAWGKRMDKQYFPDDKPGQFVRQCPLLGLTADQWEYAQTQIQPESSKEFYEVTGKILRSIDMLELAADGVALGLDKVRNNCWECGSPAPAGTKLCVCAGCRVPLYCSKACQTSAWKDGHIHKCKELKEMHEVLRHSLGVVEHFHNEELPGGGCHTDPEFDCLIARLMGTPSAFRFHACADGYFVASEGPKMEFFFKNIAAIHRNEWWFSPEECTREQHWEELEKCATMRDMDKEQIGGLYSNAICAGMCYDIEGAARHIFGVACTFTMSLVAVFSPMIAFIRHEMRMSVVSRSLFLEMATLVDPKPKEYVRKRSNQTKWEAFKMYRDRYHK